MDSYQIDSIDIIILDQLQRDGLMTQKQLSKIAHRSESPIAERIARLKKLGYISSTVALLDISKIKSTFTAFPLIQLRDHSTSALARFKEEITRHPEIMECFHVTGQYDFLLKIVLSDINAYNEFLKRVISPLPYVGAVQSFPVLSEEKRETAYLL